jgi:hypothetical protein
MTANLANVIQTCKFYVKQSTQVSPFLQATKALRESIGIESLCFQTSALGGEGSASRPGRLLPRKKPGVH